MSEDLARFAADLRDLREARGVSLQRIQTESRIPLDVLAQFEANGLAGHSIYNRVYLRSLVRTYAQSVGLSPEAVLAALDGAFEGRYDGQVRSIAEAEPYAPPAVVSPVLGAEPPAPMEPSGYATVPSVVPSVSATTPMAPAERRAVPLMADFQPGESGNVFEGLPDRPGLPGWVLGLLGLLLVGGLAAAGFWWMGRTPAEPSPDPATVEAPAPERTTPPALTPPPAAAERTPLGDTLRLVVTAEGASLQGLRIRADADVRRPYWLNAGESRTLTFRDSVAVFEPPAAARLVVEGRPVPESARRADGLVVIRRADVAAW